MDITIEITEITAESSINETVIICDVVIADTGGSIVDVPIETISKNGTPLPITAKNVDITVPTKTSELEKDDVYTKTEINNKLSAVYKYKGSVLTYDLLPTDAENADVWNVTNGTTPELNGMNYAWNNTLSEWDELGGIIGLATLTENGLMSKEDFAALAALKIHNHSGQSINPDNMVFGKEYTDEEAAGLPVNTIFQSLDQRCLLLKTSSNTYLNIGEEITTISRIGDDQNHLEGQACYISGGATQLNNVSLASSVTGKLNCLATQDVLNTGEKTGRYCYAGMVHTFPYANVIKSTDNAATWVDGADLYLCNEAGKYSTVKEAAPAKASYVGRITNRNGANITVMFIPVEAKATTDLSDWDGNTNAFADAEKILIRKTNGLVQEMTKTDFYAILDDYFARLIGGNTFADTQNFDGRINHKAGEYFYTAASKTADTINDTRVINSAGVEIHSICTANGATKGGGTWVEMYKTTTGGVLNAQRGLKADGIKDNDSFIILNVNYPANIESLSDTRAIKLTSEGGNAGLYSPFILFDVGAGGGKAYMYTRRVNGYGARFYISTQDTAGNIINPFVIDENGNFNTIIGKYQYNAASPTVDTINDRRTSVVAGVKIEEICTAASGTKGGGTWLTLSTTDSTGKMQFLNTGRRKWGKHTAQTITFTTGSTADNVSTLQTGMDGNYMTIVEASGVPGIDAYVEFTSVQAFERVRLLAAYVGTTSHQVLIQVYDWVGATWRTFDTLETNAFDTTNLQFQNHEFTVYEDANYIGTSANLGKVRVRFYHPVTGNATHRFYVDELSLRQ